MAAEVVTHIEFTGTKSGNINKNRGVIKEVELRNGNNIIKSEVPSYFQMTY